MLKKIMRRVYLLSAMLVVILGLNGCSTMNDVVKAKENHTDGTSKVYAINQDQAWKIAKAVFRWEGTDAIEEHRDQGYMLTSSGPNLVSWGTVMGAWLKPIDKNHTKVTVITKRRITVNIATTLTEATFQEKFAEAVAIVKSGKPLPAECPA